MAACLAIPTFAEAPKSATPSSSHAVTALPMAELWVRTSAEYRGLCHQTYNAATDRLRYLAPIMERRSDGKLRLPGSQKPAAVILDLDETVIDNSPFQAFAARRGVRFSGPLWAAWVEFQALRPSTGQAIPGAVDFLAYAKELGVTPIFITNRATGEEGSTTQVLQNLGICVTDIDKRLLHRYPSAQERERALKVVAELRLNPESLEARKIVEGEGSKEARRRLVQQNYDVLAYFGDVLGDFEACLPGNAESAQPPYVERQKEGDRQSPRWGRNWFLLPNPMYGPWAPGAAIPNDGVEKALDDHGFEEYLKQKGLFK